MTVDVDDLLKKMPLEERLLRHRCVEAWSIAVPWSGFPMKALVEFAANVSRIMTPASGEAPDRLARRAMMTPSPDRG